MRLIFLVVLIFAMPAFSKVDTSKCTAASLGRKNCILQRGKHKIQFRGETISSFDGIHRSLASIPVVGENVDWNRIEWKAMAGRQFIELEVWEAPKTDGELSPLRWIVYELKGVDLQQKLDQVIQRRKKLAEKNGFEMDKLRSHKIFADKKTIQWKIEFEAGELK